MAATALGSLWAEPRPPGPTGPGPRDGLLVAAFGCWSLVEILLRHDLAPLPFVLIVAAATILPLPWRRTHPWGAVAVAFGALLVIDLVRVLARTDGTLLNSVSATLILTYGVFRWGSGREAAAGLGLAVLWLSVSILADPASIADTVAAYAFFLFAATLGSSVRYRARVRVRDLEQARAREREQLARELHDTVAHHVSGIAIQAQAGRAVAAAHPDRAVEALTVIEDSATRTLTELRAIVGVLRAAPDELAPQPGVAEVRQLATDPEAYPRVEVALDGELDDLSPAVGAALFRLAQESVTNARRHARQASRIAVRVAGEVELVRLRVEDDGGPGVGGHGAAGFGLVGMRERASLLGGTFHAGPRPGGGWQVEATLPKTTRAPR